MRFWRGLIQRREVRICLLCAMVAMPVGAGCESTSPFLLSAFNGKLPAGGVAGDAVDENDDDDGVDPNDRTIYEHVDQLPAELRTFQHFVGSSSTFPVQWRALFVVTAGEGGFVRNEDDIEEYMLAGYMDLLPPNSDVGTTTTIGCVTLTLTRGTRLLGMRSGDFLGEIVTLPGNTSQTPDLEPIFAQDVRDIDRNPNLPIPERIVFTTLDPNFDCINENDPCTQKAFQFFDQLTATQEVGTPVDARSIQGTLCSLGIERAPEVRLDLTNDGGSLPFQFVPGGVVLWRVLNQSVDTQTLGQIRVAWTVVDANGNFVHIEQP